MRHYITFEKTDLSATVTTLGHNLHKIAEHCVYFQQYAKIHNVEHDFVINTAIEEINKSLEILKNEFNLPIEYNSCLELFEGNRIVEVINRANKDHDNPYRKTIPKMQEFIRVFLVIAEHEGKDTDWEDVKNCCKRLL